MTTTKGYAVVVAAREQAERVAVERETQALAAREVAGRTIATLISPGTELAGSYQGTSFPRTPGYAAVFEVEEVGSEVTNIKVGDHVFCTGRHQSYQSASCEEVVPLPEGLSPEIAVFARMMGVTMSTLTTTSARPPEKVLVTGLGLVGHLAAQIFARCGYEVMASEPVASRREIALQAGIKPVFPAVPLDDPNIVDHVGLVLECSGHEQAALDGCRVVRMRGEVVLVATPWQRRTDLYAHEVLDAVFCRYVVLRSGWEWEVPLLPTDFRTNSIFGNFEAAVKWLTEGCIRVDSLYTKVPPREAQRAYQDLLHKRGRQLTFVLDWTDCL